MEAMQKLGAAARRAGVPATTLCLIEARASQINGCSVCLDMHSRELRAAGEPDERIFMVGAWREAPYFSDAERAALALTEAATRLADRSDPIPEEVWEETSLPLRRVRTGRFGDRDRGDQRVEPHQRRHQAGDRQLGGPMDRTQSSGRPGRVTASPDDRRSQGTRGRSTPP
jgi:AhpD family alkylhydroperoxidase